MTRVRLVVLVLAVLGALLSALQLERVRGGVERATLAGTGTTPATVWRRPGADPAPVVLIAHGFAGSRQLMEGFALTLADAGYIAVSFDYEGHGRNPVPMSGDVTRIDGTTERLIAEGKRVADATLALPGADGRLALVGHSMASDIVVRQALRDPRVSATVAVSMFSEAVTETAPRNLLIVVGEWERFLAAEAVRALRLADADARLGQTLGDPAQGMGRRGVLAPAVEHVGVLYSATTLRETRAWLDTTFARPAGEGPVPVRGGWIALLLVSVVALAWPLAGLLRGMRGGAEVPVRLSGPRFAAVLAAAGIGVPLVLAPLDARFLPVLVADYLALHFALFGLVVLAGVWRLGGWVPRWPDRRDIAVTLAVAGFGIGVFGLLALDRYVASFWPHPGRLAVIAAIALGAVPFMVADAVLTEGGRAPRWRRLAVRAVALGSLALAVALDFERLFFLVIILPVIVLFFLLFGTAGGWAGRASLRPGAVGAGLGLFLAWALGVTFPLFAG